MTTLGHVVALSTMAVAIIAILVIGTLAAAEIIPTGRRTTSRH
jgi:hypothetical protein